MKEMRRHTFNSWTAYSFTLCQSHVLGTTSVGRICSTKVVLKYLFNDLSYSGGSLIKVAYATAVGDKVSVHLVTYPRDRLDDALTLLQTQFGGSTSPDTVVNATGNGCHQFGETIKSNLNIE